MTDTNDMLALYDKQMRRPPPTPSNGARYEQDGPVLRIVGQLRGFISAPRDVGVRGLELDRLIARQRDYFAARGESVQWKVRAHDQPTDLSDRLRAAGFVPGAPDTVLIGLATEMATEPVLPDGVVLRQVTANADMHRIAAMQSTAWGQDWSRLGSDLIARVSAAPDEIAVMVAEADGDVVSAAWLVFLRPEAEAAGLWGGSTLPPWRGRGIYRALVASRAKIAVARGVTFLQADASKDSAPILGRLGFHPVTTVTPYVWSPAQT